MNCQLKIFVINGEKPDEKLEIEIGEYSLGKYIKDKLGGILRGYKSWEMQHFRLIYSNIIINDEDNIKKYKLCEGSEIWCGRVEDYLSGDDVIVEVFLAGCLPGFHWLIVRSNDSIATVRSIIEKVHPKINRMWDCKGNEMQNNQSVTEIDESGYYRLIVSCAEEAQHLDAIAFEACCKRHDKVKINHFYDFEFSVEYQTIAAVLPINDTDCISEVTRVKLINQIEKIKDIILSNDAIDTRLNANFAHFPSSFVNSNFLFCDVTCGRIWDICGSFFILLQDEYDDEFSDVAIFFRLSLWVALGKYFEIRRDHSGNAEISLNRILLGALEYFLTVLLEFRFYWKDSIELFIIPLLLTCHSDIELDQLLANLSSSLSYVTVRTTDGEHRMILESDIRTVGDVKKVVSLEYDVSSQDLYCINPSTDDTLKDSDPFDTNTYLILEIMKRMESFDIIKELANGGFGAILVCQEKMSGRQFILKKSLDENQSLDRDIFIGINLVYTLNADKYIGLIRDGNYIYLAMPYMPGGSLTSYIKKCFKHRSCIQEKDIAKISYEILTQINEIHNSNIVHRDIKPDNIIFDGEGNAKLIDFGLAKFTGLFGEKDLLKTINAYTPGTINYMAPELLKQNPYSDKIDIWSLGMVLVEMVTGNPPFYRIGPARAILELKKMRNFKLKTIKPISKELNEFIHSCLTVNPDERPTGKELLKFQLIIDYLNM